VAVLSSGARRILVAAGPGSGKTRLLAAWVARAPTPVLALTFTNRAARELSERTAGTPDATAATFHSFCWSLLKEREPTLTSVLSPSDRLVVLEHLLPDTGFFRLQAFSDGMEKAWEGQQEPDSELADLMRRYRQATDAMGAADVASLVSRALELDLPGRHRSIAVDELQDLNPPQYELLRRLCDGAGDAFAIGDPDQAIYAFRGSDRRLFFRFQAELEPAMFTLTRNYRSAAGIVSAAASVMSLARPASPMRPAGAPVRLAECEDPGDEGRFIASGIRDLVGGIDSVSVDGARSRAPGDWSFSDIAILARTRAVRDALLPALLDAGLPLSLGAHAPLSEEEPLRSVVAALRISVNAEDLVARRILGERTAQALAAGIPGVAAQEGVEAALALIARTLVPLDRSLPSVALGEEALRREAARHGSDLRGFIAGISLCTRESEGMARAQRISLLTFHAAKGLEFPVVFIAGAEEGITPLEDRRGTDPAEERRLFYVALTRARDVLTISHCRQRSRHGTRMSAGPSRFLAEIPQAVRMERGPRTASSRQLSLFD
jgi:superfamily I DNA/RNA helicase